MAEFSYSHALNVQLITKRNWRESPDHRDEDAEDVTVTPAAENNGITHHLTSGTGTITALSVNKRERAVKTDSNPSHFLHLISY